MWRGSSPRAPPRTKSARGSRSGSTPRSRHGQSRLGPKTTKETRWTCSSTRASSTSRDSASRCHPVASPTRSTRRSPSRSRAGYPVVVKAQVKVGGRGKAGGIKLAIERGRGAHARWSDPRHGHQGPRRAADLGRERERHRLGVLRELHARPAEQGAPRDVLVGGRGRDRGGRGRTNPDAIARIAIDPVRGLEPRGRAQVGRRGRARRGGPRAGGRAAGQALRLLRGGRLRPCRDQPPDPHDRRAGARPRRQGHAR